MHGPISPEDRKRLLPLIEAAVEKFNEGDWLGLGSYTGCSDIIENHGRLLRSLSFGDPDYSGHAHSVMRQIVERDHENLNVISDFMARTIGVGGMSVSTAPGPRPISFAPSVFDVPQGGVEPDLVAVMMPFAAEFEDVFTAIAAASQAAGFRCVRAKDIWQHAVVIQDVFSLIFRAQVVICDFTDKNPNVFYEAGIAHTLGKHVVPLTQTKHDIPFDLQHHRYLLYKSNDQGLAQMQTELAKRLRALHPSGAASIFGAGSFNLS